MTRPEGAQSDFSRPRGCGSWCLTSCIHTEDARPAMWPCWCAGFATTSRPTGFNVSEHPLPWPVREPSVSKGLRSLESPRTYSAPRFDRKTYIGKTLRRAMPDRNLRDPEFLTELTRRLSDPDRQPPTDYPGFISDPLSIWIESIVGLRNEDGTGRLVRARPRDRGQE